MSGVSGFYSATVRTGCATHTGDTETLLLLKHVLLTKHAYIYH